MTGNIIHFDAKPQREINADAIELIEGTLERLRSGEVVAVAIVEVLADGAIATANSKTSHYHHLTSGAARLVARLATE